MRQTRLKHIQRACSARGTYSKRISHTPGTRRASRKFLSMFKNFLIPNTHFYHFFNTPGARFTYTLLCDCCFIYAAIFFSDAFLAPKGSKNIEGFWFITPKNLGMPTVSVFHQGTFQNYFLDYCSFF